MQTHVIQYGAGNIGRVADLENAVRQRHAQVFQNRKVIQHRRMLV